MNNKEVHLSEAIEIIEEVLSSGGEFRMVPKGTSMLPLIVQGKDSVVLKRKPVSEIQKHDIIFYRRDNGQFILHRVLKVCDDGTYILCGDNQTYLEKGVRPDQIIGYVSQINKKEKRLSPTSVSYRIYMLIWMWMPYRKTVLFIKRGFRFLKRKLNKKIKKSCGT